MSRRPKIVRLFGLYTHCWCWFSRVLISSMTEVTMFDLCHENAGNSQNCLIIIQNLSKTAKSVEVGASKN